MVFILVGIFVLVGTPPPSNVSNVEAMAPESIEWMECRQHLPSVKSGIPPSQTSDFNLNFGLWKKTRYGFSNAGGTTLFNSCSAWPSTSKRAKWPSKFYGYRRFGHCSLTSAPNVVRERGRLS
uniref:Secreted protein n=1 Tax=Panagrellus redivivus TaxID=6233 RepID=A0A7E4ULH8_PANRE